MESRAVCSRGSILLTSVYSPIKFCTLMSSYKMWLTLMYCSWFHRFHQQRFLTPCWMQFQQVWLWALLICGRVSCPPLPRYHPRNAFRPQAGFSTEPWFLCPSPAQRWCLGQAGSMVLVHDFSWKPSRTGGKRRLGFPGQCFAHRLAMVSPKSGCCGCMQPGLGNPGGW